MSSDRKRLVRAWAPRRRTGCITCKIRHIRCDEGKPACKKCLDTGRKCDGYVSSTVHQVASSSSSDLINSPLPISHAPSLFQLPGQREHRAFYYFIKSTAPQLSGYFSPDIWLQDIPRLSFYHSALRHAIVAIAAVHEGYVGGCEDLTRNSQLEAYSFALKQYSISIKDLQDTISLQHGDIEPILLCCVLYVCFDSLRGNYAAASTHLKAGMKLLLAYQSTSTETKAVEAGSARREIVRVLTALGIQVGTFTDSMLPFDTISIWEQIEIMNVEFQPATFDTINDARHSLHMILSRVMLHHTEHRGQVSQLKPIDSPIRSSGFDTSSPISMVVERLSNWSQAFDTMIQRGFADLSSNTLKGSALLKMHYATLKILVRTARFDESQLNQSDPMALFETVVSLARSLILSADFSTQNFASISSDLGLIGPLFTIIARCTVPRLRWEALALLRSTPRREGMWDAEVVGRIATGILGLEETSILKEKHLEEQSKLEVTAVRVTSDEDEIGDLDKKLIIELDYNGEDSEGQRMLTTKRL